MPSDWESESGSEEEEVKPTTTAKPIAKPVRHKWEDEEEEAPDEWDASADEDEKPKPVASNATAPKKKGTLKQKIAEKEAQKAARIAAGLEDDDDDEEGSVVNDAEQRRRDKEREVMADLNNATSLLGAAALGGTSSSELDAIISSNPRTKEDFIKLSSQIIELIKRHQDKPLYAAFVEHHVRELASPLKDVDVRKAASGLTTLANEKQKEARDKASGKKKPKTVAKPGLGAMKASGKLDTRIYQESLDDFGAADDDFM